MSELKPCPFCGGEATMYYWRKMGTEFMQWGRVRCTNDYCAMSGVDWSDIRGETRHETNREEDAIKRWNTRAPTEETARADAYKKAINERRTSLTKYDQGWNDAMSFVRQSVEEQTP